jgi:predicted nucleic acid-binding Zn ribbon protein
MSDEQTCAFQALPTPQSCRVREIMSKNRQKNLRSFVIWILWPAVLLGSSAVSLAVQRGEPQGEPIESPQGETIGHL